MLVPGKADSFFFFFFLRVPQFLLIEMCPCGDEASSRDGGFLVLPTGL